MSALLPTSNLLSQIFVFSEQPDTTAFQHASDEGCPVEAIHSMNHTFESGSTTSVLECLVVGNCSSWSLFLVMLYSSVAYSVISRLLFWYNFVTVWRLIAEERRVDAGDFYKHRTRRRMSIKDAIKCLVTPESMSSCTSCCICLCDFYENELVTRCEESCGKWYHKECLFEWLQLSDSCPCCRNNMLVANKPNGFFTDLSKCLGFDPLRHHHRHGAS